MNLREQFEMLHPVPDGVRWLYDRYIIDISPYATSPETERYNHLWQGFQCGYTVATERAAIRAAKEQK